MTFLEADQALFFGGRLEIVFEADQHDLSGGRLMNNSTNFVSASCITLRLAILRQLTYACGTWCWAGLYFGWSICKIVARGGASRRLMILRIQSWRQRILKAAAAVDLDNKQ